MWKSSGSLCFSHLRLLLGRWHRCCSDTFVSMVRREDAACSPMYAALLWGCGRRIPCSCHWPEPTWFNMPGEHAGDAKKCQLELFFWFSFFVPVYLEAGCRSSLGWFYWVMWWMVRKCTRCPWRDSHGDRSAHPSAPKFLLRSHAWKEWGFLHISALWSEETLKVFNSPKLDVALPVTSQMQLLAASLLKTQYFLPPFPSAYSFSPSFLDIVCARIGGVEKLSGILNVTAISVWVLAKAKLFPVHCVWALVMKELLSRVWMCVHTTVASSSLHLPQGAQSSSPCLWIWGLSDVAACWNCLQVSQSHHPDFLSPG